MHSYDYRCNDCQHRFSLHYKTYATYDAATPVCPQCDSENLSRIISKVAFNLNVSKPRDYREMSGEELNAAVHSSRPQETGEVFQQIMQHEKDITPEFVEVTDRLVRGESMSSIEKEVQVPDRVPKGPGLAKELLDLRIRDYEHHKHDPDHRRNKGEALQEYAAKQKAGIIAKPGDKKTE